MLIFFKKLFENQFIQAICFAVALWLAYEIRTILALFFLAFVVMAGFEPVSRYFQKRGAPRILAVLIPYVILVVVLGGAAYIIIPAIIAQVTQLAQVLPQYINFITQKLSHSSTISGTVNSVVSSFAGSVSSTLATLPGYISEAFISTFTVLIVSLYLLWDKISPDKPYIWFIPDRPTSKKLQDIEQSMGAWLRGQIILSLIIGVMAWLGLFLIGVNFSAALGVLAGILEVVPYVGPIISAVIAILVALGMSWTKAVITVILFFIIQQLEGNVIVPQVMKYSVKIHPITIIISLLVGAKILGILGAVVAVPLVTAFWVALSSTPLFSKYSTKDPVS